MKYKIIVPSRRGADIKGGRHRGRELDGHVRGIDGEGITVDIFDSAIPTKGPKDPWVDGDHFHFTRGGAEEATEFVRSYGFDVDIRLRRR